VLLRQGHGRAVDWWSLGALTFEMLVSLPPFYHRNREIMFENIVHADLVFPAHVSPVVRFYSRNVTFSERRRARVLCNLYTRKL